MSKKVTSPNQMQKQVQQGKASIDVIRVDNPKIPVQEPHIHLKDGTALNMDGTIHDAMKGIPNLSKKVRRWLLNNGWKGN